jgi:hypothetical protein
MNGGRQAQPSGDKGAGTNGAANEWRRARTGASEHKWGPTVVAPPPARAAAGAGVLHVLPLPRLFPPLYLIN